MSREIQPLFITILKNVAKQPLKHITESTVERAFSKDNLALITKLNVDIVQVLVDYISEAGRLTDDVVPAHLFTGKSDVSLKNSKISGRYLLKVINVCSKSLVRLDISGCFQIGDDAMNKILVSCPNMSYLNIKNCRKLTDNVLVSICSVNPAKLESLNIGGNFNMTVKGVQLFVDTYKGIERLKDLNLSGLMITDDIITRISSHCPVLSSFGLGYSDVSEGGMLKLFTNMGSQLIRLNVSWMASPHSPVSTAFLLESISTYCPRLVDLDVSGFKGLTAAHLVQLVETRLAQYSSSPADWSNFTVLHAKFISSPKSTVETTVSAVYPWISVNC